jgi:glycosyltransferase involved in cell wall biosynthesis
MLTWNRKKFIEELFISFYKNISNNLHYEYLIIDNNSNDGTVNLLQNASENNSRIKVWYNNKNKDLNEYKKLFKKSKGQFIIIIDDDVIDFPKNFDEIMVEYMNEFIDFGFIALDVIQNEYTNGAKPEPSMYKDIEKNGKIISEGPTGGWCSIFRNKDYKKIRIQYELGGKLNMKCGEDGKLSSLFEGKLKLRHGLIKDTTCFHACGPYYSKQYGYLDRDIAKYKKSGLENFVNIYQQYKE